MTQKPKPPRSPKPPAPPPPDRTSPKAATYLLLIVPIILFIASLYIPPGVGYDPGEGFRVLQNMLKGEPLTPSRYLIRPTSRRTL